MSVLGKLFASAVDVALVPIEVVKDAVTLGGAVLGNEETYTGKRLRDAQDHLQDAIDEAAE